MKSLVSGILGIFICGYSYAEVDTKVYNNYLSLYIPEIAPHSELIKHQDIYYIY
ncbi:hypothetical protein [Gilliamella sp. ESL0254]|uniref:hypothetical protein n=1 Tax=Gilliamella sp. ESL0254 TaxID=2705035 RepID=UPI0015803169|nr:hypothetical protein [Gilliamella sp. ESL0254]NUF27536.1 hypothetical protein [Gilliamella sp. ESL0254]